MSDPDNNFDDEVSVVQSMNRNINPVPHEYL
jgi:hypothetical protein